MGASASEVRARVRVVSYSDESLKGREDHASLYLCRAWCIHSSPAPISLYSASPKLFSHAVVVYGAVELPTSFSLGIHSFTSLRLLSTYPDITRTHAQLVPRRDLRRSPVHRPFLSLKKTRKNREEGSGQMAYILLGVARAGMQPWALMRGKHLQ